VSLEKPPSEEADFKSLPPEAGGGSARRALESRRRRKFAWFLVVESIAGGLSLASILAGLSLRFASESWTAVFRVLPVSAAVIATVVPILFYGNSRRHR
jgi:hypothetical protein